MATSPCDHARRTRWGICYFFDSPKLRHTEEALRGAQVQLQRPSSASGNASPPSYMIICMQQMLVVGRLRIGQGRCVAIGLPECEQALQNVDDNLVRCTDIQPDARGRAEPVGAARVWAICRPVLREVRSHRHGSD